MKVLALLALAACSGPSGPATFAGLRAITLRGQAYLGDGSPARQRQFQVRFLGDGDMLFPQGVHDCSAGDDHAQALQTVNVVTAEDGSFFVSAPINQFVRATDDTCTHAVRDAGRLTTLNLKVQTDPDAASCLAYCRPRENSDGTCFSDCVGRGAKFVWSTELSSRDVGSSVEVRLDQLGPPLTPVLPEDPALPDLQVDGVAAAGSLEIDHQDFDEDACEVEDACIAAPGHRTLLRFDGVIENLGQGDLVLGDPSSSPYFTYSECHGHYHLKDILTAELVDRATGTVVTRAGGDVVSQKQGFCIKDIDQVAGDAPIQYDCDNQGLSSGWADVYSRELGCQWIDVTDVPPGPYALRLTVNATHQFPEGDYSNNSALIPVVVPQE
jgi:hypothetical protein